MTAWTLLSTAVPAPGAPGDCHSHLVWTLGLLMQGSAQMHDVPTTQEGKKKIYFYPDPCTDSPNGPNSNAGITGRGKRRGRVHEAVTHFFLFDQRGGLVAERDNKVCSANITAERKLCHKIINRCSFPKPNWASEKRLLSLFFVSIALSDINDPHICWYSCSYTYSSTLSSLNSPSYQTYYLNYLH